MKTKNWFWGLFFIVAAALVIINQMGYLVGINLFTLICTIFLVPIIIKSIAHVNFFGILFPLAILGILFAEPLGITNLVPWPILAAALLGSIGLSLIFHNSKWHSEYYHCNFDKEEQIINEEDSDTVSCSVKFGASTKYVNTDNFKKGYFSSSFGALKIYFDKAKIQDEGAEIYLDVSFSGVEIYVPKEWKLVNNVSSAFGALDEKNHNLYEGEKMPVVVKGNIKFGGVEIIYV